MGYRDYRQVFLRGTIPEEHIIPMRKLAVFASLEWRVNPIFNLFIANNYEETDWIKSKVEYFIGVGKVNEGEEGVEEIKKELKAIIKEFPGTTFHVGVSDEEQQGYPYSFTLQ